ncbi:uncharacterized protein [Lepidochelys kempii]|uniref:uncharacterized protein isoform X1 n=1 Tax=Lepidochelys kempii TaxID=8472 RepID=UPI003C6F42A7
MMLRKSPRASPSPSEPGRRLNFPQGCKRKSPQQQQELCVPQPFRADSPSPANASCFMGPDSEEKEPLDYVDGFLKGNEQDETKTLKFLDCVSTFSRAVLTRSPERNLAAFLSKALLVEKIKQCEATTVGNGTIQPARHLLLQHLLPASSTDHPGHGGCSEHQDSESHG